MCWSLKGWSAKMPSASSGVTIAFWKALFRLEMAFISASMAAKSPSVIGRDTSTS